MTGIEVVINFPKDPRTSLGSAANHNGIGAGFLSSGGKSLENRLGYIMLDWEIQESKLIGRLTREEIQGLCREFPLWFYQQMHDKLLVDPDTFVTGAQFSFYLIFQGKKLT